MTDKQIDQGKTFPIVAIGASAGGLNSIQCFLNALPKDFGFAIVFLQHLSHKHGNLLPGLLRSGRPSLDIGEISDGMEALPGKLYLCPPGVELRIEKGILHTAPFSGERVHLPIDEFFTSLAEDAGERAIAVIFSGAGTDGARGIHEIKNAGGTVFVQDPATAEFPGMSLSAIDTGKADGVLQPEEIASEILKLHGAISVSTEGVITWENFETFYRLIFEKTGYRFNYYKQNVINRRIRRRMYLRGVLSVKDYIKMVAENDAEAGALAADFMIGVTSFFRDRLAWKALNLGVIRKLAAEDNDIPVRVWTPACATGEEAYSIAMMLHNEFELAGRKREIQVFATDVNDRALDKAREGKYPGSIVADVPPEYMKRYFTCSEDGLSVIIGKDIRERVVVAKQDLLTDPPFSRLDLVICRNLLIYLEPQAQEKCITLFHYALKEGGYLFLGNAESVGRSGAFFRSLAHKKCRVYQKLESTTSARVPLPVPFASERPVPLPVRASVTEQQSVTGAIQESLLEGYAPAAVAINQHYDIIYHNGPTNRYLCQPRGVPTQNLLELLSENLRSRVRGAIYRTTQESKPVLIRASIPGDDEGKIHVTLRISRLKEDLSLIVFHEKGGISEQEASAMEAADVDVNAIRQLESELSATRADLQSHIEQLKSLNEELQSSNEELQAANEELETSREELQSLNEELITVNSQLQGKIEEQDETNNDLNNFLASTNIPTIFLDHLFRVKRFTPAMSKLLKLIPSDVGRPIADMSLEGLGPELIADAQTVLDNLAAVKKEILLKEVWYVRTALPYRTSDNRIEGVIITYTDVTDLKREEERTRHLASFPQLNPNPIVELDASGKIIFFNPAAEKALDSLDMGKDDLRIFLPQDIESILKNLENKTEATFYRELNLKGKVFGETIYLSSQFNVARIYAYDITERKRAEDKIIRAKEEWERTFDSVPDMIAILDNNHRIIRVNESMAKRLGRKAEECFGLPCYEVMHGTTAPPGFCPHTRTMKDGCEHIQDVYEECLGMDLLVTTTPFFDAQGQITGSVHVAHDITVRKRAEDLLRKAHDDLELRVKERTKELTEAHTAVKTERQRFYDVLEMLPVYVILLTPDYHVPFANRFFRERFGESHGMRCYEYLFGRTEPCTVCDTYSVLKTNAPHHWEWTGPDGRNYDIFDFPFTDTDGSPLIMEVGIDITERKQAEDGLRKVNETLEQRVAERTEELSANYEELVRFNNAAVGRELRMIELKKEINELCAQAGLPPRFPLDFEKEDR
jgi:two-component system CheB/CheR fusion protein